MFGARVRGRVVSAVTAVAVAGVSLLGAGVAAASAASVADIEPGKAAEGKIVVHKRTQPVGDTDPGDGSELASPPGDPLGGVEFTLYRVKAADGSEINLESPAGWSKARPVIDGFTPAELDNQVTPTTITTNGKTYNLDKVGSETTNDSNGMATFDTKKLGLYLLVESDPATGKTGVVAAAEPTLVTVPYAADKGPWKYQVHLYPKNAVQDLQKDVADEGSATGEDVTFKVTGKVPNPTGGKELKSFKIVDQLDPRLKFDKVTGFTLAGAALVEGTDYTVTVQGQEVTVEFKNPALLTAGQQFQFNVVTDVKEPGDDGAIENKVTPWVNNVEGKDSGAATTVWGALRVWKYADVGGKEESLSGAKFKLYTDQAAQNEVPGVGELVTGDDGTVTVDVLKPGTYWLKETQAPAGYTELPDPVKVTVKAGGVVTTAGSERNYVTVKNTRQSLPGLPNTGAAGLVALMVFGGGAVAAAVVLAARARRREAAGSAAN